MVRGHRSSAVGFVGVCWLIVSCVSGMALAAPPRLVSAVSRMSHAGAGEFDLQLPLKKQSGIECRDTADGLKLVLTFDEIVVRGTATVSVGKGSVKGQPTFDRNKMIVKLTGVADAQAITVTVSNVANQAGEKLASASVGFRILKGDVNASGDLTEADLTAAKAALKKSKATSPVNRGNFRFDVNRTGSLSTTDVSSVKVGPAVGSVASAGATSNTAPTISTIPDQTAVTNQPSTPVGFTVGDAESDPSTLFVTGASSDQATVPDANIAISGTGASRTITITPAAGITTVTNVTITVTVSDSLLTTPTQFTLTVTPPPTVYLATLAPISGVISLGYGSATLTVSGDRTSAILSYSYSNMAGADTDDAVYSPGDVVIYDVPVGKARGDLQPDGTYLWHFGANAATYLAAIETNTAYMILESAANPAGELKGVFQKVNGSQVFTPPADAPPITINPPTASDASRFLQQAAFGGTGPEIAALSNASAGNASTALNDWLAAQFAMPGPIYPDYSAASITPVVDPLPPQSASQPYSSSSMYRQLYNRCTIAQPPLVYGDDFTDDRIHEAWWKNAVTAPDQLRQRVATALSELLVVSENDANVDFNLPGLASYYDMLANDAFGNYRQILSDVTLHPIMGIYLNMKGNKKAVPPASPNENYAREIMQLFSVGLYMLQPDGTLMLDSAGRPIPTYDQGTITNFAQVFTGWDQNNNKVNIPTLISATAPATGAVIANFSSFYQRPMVITPGNHSTTTKTLLAYPGNATYPGASQPGFIPARATQTAQTATAELDFALDNIFNHPNTGPYVCRQLIQRLVGSNPSPGYVYRVAKAFADDGSAQHVRGNMKAVITAILTDYEARSPALINGPGYGHCREPLIRMVQLIRSCGGFSKSGKWLIGKTDTTLEQTILRSPTVFNFFSPAYSEAGPIFDAGIVSPELDIVFSTTITNAQNMIYSGIYTPNYAVNPPTGTGFRGDAFGNDVYLDFSANGSGLLPLAQNSGVSVMIDKVALLLTGAPLQGRAKSTIQNFITTKISPTDYLGQVKAAVHLVSTSAQAAAQH